MSKSIKSFLHGSNKISCFGKEKWSLQSWYIVRFCRNTHVEYCSTIATKSWKDITNKLAAQELENFDTHLNFDKNLQVAHIKALAVYKNTRFYQTRLQSGVGDVVNILEADWWVSSLCYNKMSYICSNYFMTVLLWGLGTAENSSLILVIWILNVKVFTFGLTRTTSESLMLWALVVKCKQTVFQGLNK